MKKINILPYENIYRRDLIELFDKKRQTLMKHCPYLKFKNHCEESVDTIIGKSLSRVGVFSEKGRLIGYMFPEIKKDEDWGDSLSLEFGQWYLPETQGEVVFSRLYASAFQPLVKGVVEHKAYCPAYDKVNLKSFFQSGFGMEQAYAVAEPDNLKFPIRNTGIEGLKIRKAEKEDRDILREFSSLIALYQSGAPVWGGAPENYLIELEKGFGKLIDDEEALVLLAFYKAKPSGYQVWFPLKPDQDEGIPEHAFELAVSGVIPEFRGIGIGSALTEQGILKVKAQGGRYCFIDWRTTNPLSSVFWRKIGFVPYLYRLVRRFLPYMVE